MQSQFIKPAIIPSASEIQSFGEPLEKFNIRLLDAAPVNAVAATKDFTAFVLTAKTKGVVGNAISITLIEPDEDGELIVELADDDPYAILVTLEKDTTIVTTGADLVAALNDDADIALLVTATGTGSDPLAAAEQAFLEGGINGTYAPTGGLYYMDATNIYIAIAANSTADANWRKVALGSAY